MEDVKKWIREKLKERYGSTKHEYVFSKQKKQLKDPFPTIEALRTGLDRYCNRISSIIDGSESHDTGNDERLNAILGFSTTEQCAHSFKSNLDAIDYALYPEMLLERVCRSYEKNGEHREALTVLLELARRKPTDLFARASLERRIATQYDLIGEGENAEERYTAARKIIDRIPPAEFKFPEIELQSRVELGCEIARWRRSGRPTGVLNAISRIRDSLSSSERILKNEIDAVQMTEFALARAQLFRVEASVRRIQGEYELASSSIGKSVEYFRKYCDSQNLIHCEIEKHSLSRSLVSVQQTNGTSSKSEKLTAQRFKDAALGAFHLGWKRLARQSELVFCDSTGSPPVLPVDKSPSTWGIDDQIHAYLVYGRSVLTKGDHEKALGLFKRAIELIDGNTQGRSLLKTVSEFGCYEAIRLAPHLKFADKTQQATLLEKLYNDFSAFGCNWGIARTGWLRKASSKRFVYSGGMLLWKDAAIFEHLGRDYAEKSLFDQIITLGLL